jgi:hypothetical protein
MQGFGGLKINLAARNSIRMKVTGFTWWHDRLGAGKTGSTGKN